LAIGFGVMFGALFAKTWRIQKIINDSKRMQGQPVSIWSKILICLRIKNPDKKKKRKERFKKSEVITWKRLLIILGIIVLGEIVILCIYTIIAPFFDLTEKVEESDIYQSKNYTRCDINPVFITFAVLLAIYNMGLMLYGVVLSWMLRNVQWTLFNESKAIAFAMYNMFFFSVLIGALEVSDAVARDTMFIVRSLGIFAGAFIAVAVLFLPKIYYICKGVRTLDGSTSRSKDSKLSINDQEDVNAEDDRVTRGLQDRPDDNSETLKLKALLRHVHSKMQDGTIPLKWADIEGENRMEQLDEEEGSSSSSSSSDPEQEIGVP